MYYIAKALQFAGLALIAIGFLMAFPALMDPRLFAAGILLGATGWIAQRFLLKS